MAALHSFSKSIFFIARIPTNKVPHNKSISIRCFSSLQATSSPSVNPLSTLSNKTNGPIQYLSKKGEPFPDQVYRWLDITGFLTRWNSRKAWILDLEPSNRLATPLITEHERKLSIFMVSNSIILFIISMYYWYHAQLHISIKPPIPQQPDYSTLDNRRNDFVWHSKIPLIFPRDRCKECRWLESSCKKLCFEKMKAEGHKFFVGGENGPLSKPHYELQPPHHGHHH